MPNQRWSLDFVFDALASSRKFRVLTVVDDFSRECLAEARKIIEECRTGYNTLRPHTSLNGRTPTEFASRPTEGHDQNRFSL